MWKRLVESSAGSFSAMTGQRWTVPVRPLISMHFLNAQELISSTGYLSSSFPSPIIGHFPFGKTYGTSPTDFIIIGSDVHNHHITHQTGLSNCFIFSRVNNLPSQTLILRVCFLAPLTSGLIQDHWPLLLCLNVSFGLFSRSQSPSARNR